MKVISCSYTIHYQPILKLRERIFEIENLLAGKFQTPLNLIPVPDEAPPEIPRISAISLHGHTSLNLSMVNAQVIAQFDDCYAPNAEKCIDYMIEKEELLSSIMDTIRAKPLYSGLITQLEYEKNSKPVEYIKNHFLGANLIGSLNDVSMRLTYTVENDYYINIEIFNKRIYELPTLQFIKPPTQGELKEKAHVLGLSLDINDRFGYNSQSGYFTDKDKINKIFYLTKTTIENKMQSYVEGGIVDNG